MKNKIRVIASDLDGTLLNSQHKIPSGNKAALKLASECGLRFIVSTGRAFADTKQIFKDCKFDMDYVVASGSEVRDNQGQILRKVYMDQSDFPELYAIIRNYPVAIRFCASDGDYMIGTEDEITDYMVDEFRHFFKNIPYDEILDNPDFRKRRDNIHCIDDIHQLRTGNVGVYKIFIFSMDTYMLSCIEEEIQGFTNIACASSFRTNLELTHIDAQKGIALEWYLDSLGYKMDEVMVLGDSLNDYSMMSLPFGASVAMENAMDEIKDVATHITKSNDDNGVAYAINLALSDRLNEIEKHR